MNDIFNKGLSHLVGRDNAQDDGARLLQERFYQGIHLFFGAGKGKIAIDVGGKGRS